MAEELEPLKCHGKKEEHTKVSADDVLNAIAEGQDIDIRYADIQGDLVIMKIKDRLELDEDARLIIQGSVRMVDSAIGGDADFAEVSFIGDANFSGASFSKDVHFASASFSKKVYFARASFNGGAYFNSAIFGAKANFVGASFIGIADFIEASFIGDADFATASFGGYAHFSGARFSKKAAFLRVAMERPADFAKLEYLENTMRVGFWNYILQPRLQSIVFLMTRGKVEKPEKKPVTDFSDMNTEVVMDGASNPYLKRYIDDEQWIESWRKHGGKGRKILFIIWEGMSHCGRSILLWAFCSVLIALMFGAVYADYAAPSWLPESLERILVRMDPHTAISPSDRIPTPFTPYYFSVVTFTTLGFGDVTPINLAAEIWLTLEVVLGYVMLGGLISIFANKLARRS